MCEAFPLRRTELDLYEADIGNIYSHYGDIFYQYHVKFSKQAAAYLGKVIKVDWAKPDKELFQLLIGGAKTKICEYCLQVDHENPFCPSQTDQQLPSSSKYSTISPRNASNTDPTKDNHGRQRVFFRGKEIYNNFNSVGGCSRMTCSFTHICKKCKGVGHEFPSCKAKGSLQQHPQQPAEKDQPPKTKPE